MGIDKEIYDIFIKMYNNFHLASLDGFWSSCLGAGPFCWYLDNGTFYRLRTIGSQLVKDKIEFAYGPFLREKFTLTKDKQQNRIELNRMKDFIEDEDLKSIIEKIIEEI